jgi:hypothetical protein
MRKRIAPALALFPRASSEGGVPSRNGRVSWPIGPLFHTNRRMSQPWDHVPAWAAEFPNDNPALHEGVSWVCLSVCGPVRPIARPRTANRPLAPLELVAQAPTHPTSAVVVPENHDSPSAAAPEGTPADLGDPVGEAGSANSALEELLPASVLGVLLERLDFDLTPTSGSIAVETLSNEPLDILDIDASDLERDTGTPTSEDSLSPLEPFVFDGGIDSGAPEKPSESAAEEVVGSALEQPGRRENVVAALDGAAAPRDASCLDEGAPTKPPKDEAFHAFVAALVEVLLAAGATRAAAVVPALLESAAGDPGALDPESQRLLVAARIAEDADGRIRLSTSFLETAQAWRDVLSGETNDLSACGTSTLDGWAGDLLKALGVGRDGKMDVRRELRRRGVAAFGMLLAA